MAAESAVSVALGHMANDIGEIRTRMQDFAQWQQHHTVLHDQIEGTVTTLQQTMAGFQGQVDTVIQQLERADSTYNEFQQRIDQQVQQHQQALQQLQSQQAGTPVQPGGDTAVAFFNYLKYF